ncbi:MAG: hypothetical protein ACM3NF_06445 [Gemmatimonadota bacterium]
MKRRSLFVLVAVAAPVARALAAGEGEAAGSVGVPWWEIFKQAVNVGILVAVLVYFLKKPLSSYLRERSELLRRSIEDAAKARAEAAEKLSDIQARMARLSGEIEEMNRRMESEAGEEAKRLHEAAQAEIARVREQSRFAAEQEVKKAREELRREAADLSAAAAEEMVRKSVTPDDQERIVRENIDKIKEVLR